MNKDRWDKAEILKKVLAGILIPVVLMICGFFCIAARWSAIASLKSLK